MTNFLNYHVTYTSAKILISSMFCEAPRDSNKKLLNFTS